MCAEGDPGQSSKETSRLMDEDNESELGNDDSQACDGTCWESQRMESSHPYNFPLASKA
jgi:hypothetical protein